MRPRVCPSGGPRERGQTHQGGPCQARPGRPRPGRQGRRAGDAGRGLRRVLHRPPADARAGGGRGAAREGRRHRAVQHGRLAPALLYPAQALARSRRPGRPPLDHRRQSARAGPRELARSRLQGRLPDRLPAGRDLRLHQGQSIMKRDNLPRPVRNESGIEIRPLYSAADVEASGGLAMLGEPGAYPFTRGIHPLMYRKQPFTMRQYTGFGNAADTNQRFKFLIEYGQTGLNVAFDLPTQCGIDSDDPQADGEIGRVGMAVDTLRDFEIAFEGIDLDKITVSLTINGAAAILIAMYLAMAEKRGFDLKRLRGTAQNDILKEFVGRGTWVFPVQPSIRLIGDTIEYCAEHAPKYSPVSVCGY